ncbi:hypothetical protein PF005_g4126 [Phytophthora fragariae]|uniref:Uncharacterized protein n=1 Tax=Phytophthora fragariae TaxID=53985 RepID=A0A6A3Z1Q1_9STRA|nr:hypothetical protein PF005_g4126 [Phytophthora fragariae]KAE9356314.1 hypothetical protein PF008_g3672 [Phytophthora fragariae]
MGRRAWRKVFRVEEEVMEGWRRCASGKEDGGSITGSGLWTPPQVVQTMPVKSEAVHMPDATHTAPAVIAAAKTPLHTGPLPT